MGAIANMVHRFIQRKEIEFCLKESASVVCLTLRSVYGKFENIEEMSICGALILTSVKDAESDQRKGLLFSGRKKKLKSADQRAGRMVGKSFCATETIITDRIMWCETDDPR